MKEWTTPDCRKIPSTTNLEEEEIVDAPGNDGNASKPVKVKRPNPWRKMMMMMMMMMLQYRTSIFSLFCHIRNENLRKHFPLSFRHVLTFDHFLPCRKPKTAQSISKNFDTETFIRMPKYFKCCQNHKTLRHLIQRLHAL